MSDEERRDTARKLREKIKKKFGKRQAKHFKQNKLANGSDERRRRGGRGWGNDSKASKRMAATSEEEGGGDGKGYLAKKHRN